MKLWIINYTLDLKSCFLIVNQKSKWFKFDSDLEELSQQACGKIIATSVQIHSRHLKVPETESPSSAFFLQSLKNVYGTEPF